MTDPTNGAPPTDRPSLLPRSLCLGEEIVPLRSGSVHYFRLSPSDWPRALRSVRRLGLGLIDVAVPWSVHESTRGVFDFGEGDRRLDLRRFIELCGEHGLRCLLHPGPAVGAELTCLGIPERVVWDPRCQARSPSGKPLVLPIPPLAFPAPSYASRTFLREVDSWYAAIGDRVADLAWPKGPIVAVRIDAGQLTLRKNPYGRDFHPDVLAGYVEFLREKYGSTRGLRRAHGDPSLDFDTVRPPRAGHDLTACLDFAEYQEHSLAQRTAALRTSLERHGFAGALTIGGLPGGGAPPALNFPDLDVEVVGIGGLGDAASTPLEVARRASAHAGRAALAGKPSFADALPAGFPPLMRARSPAMDTFGAVLALAQGLGGFNLRMAVDSDRWIGAPIDERGRPAAAFAAWQQLLRALAEVCFHELSRRIDVHVVVPRRLWRQSRALAALSPLGPAGLQRWWSPSAPRSQGPLAAEVDETLRFVTTLSEVLEQAGIAHAVVDDRQLEHALRHGRFSVLAGFLPDGGHGAELDPRAFEGRAVAVGPVSASGIDANALPSDVLQVSADPDELRRRITEAQRQLAIPALSPRPSGVLATLHHDREGRPAALFVLNTGPARVAASVDAAGAARALDAASQEPILPQSGRFQLELEPLSARLLDLRPGLR